MKIKEITQLDELQSLRPDWERLAASSSEFPFMAPSFMLPWLKFCGNKHRLRFLAAYDGENRLVGLAPLVSRQLGFGVFRFVILEFPMSGTTPPMDFLTEGNSPDIVAALLGYLMQRKDWNLLWLHQVAETSPLLEKLESLNATKQLAVGMLQKNPCYILPIRCDWETFTHTHAKKARNVRRVWRKLEKEGEVTVQRYPDDGMSLASALTMVWTVLGTSWKNISEEDRRARRFFEDLVTDLDAHGQLGLRFICLNGTPVSYLLEIVHQNAMFLFHNAYNARYQRYSLGHMILASSNQWCFEHQLRQIDYLGNSEYLAQWNRETRAFREIRALRGFIARFKAYFYFRIRDYRYEKARAATTAHRDAVKKAFRQETQEIQAKESQDD